MIKKIIYTFSIILLMTSFLYSKPQKPKNVHKSAIWLFNLWSYEDSRGNIIVWFPNGKIKSKVEIFKNKNDKYRKTVRYYKNSSIKLIGIEKFVRSLSVYNKKVGWIEIGKWKEYYKNGNIKREYCLTPVFKSTNVGYSPEKCGIEKLYNKKGKLVKTVRHRVKCKYGCKEVKE